MSELGDRYARIKLLLCADCPIRATCPQFPEQMDVCADALLIQAEEVDDLPRSLAEFLAEYDEED